MTHHVLPSVDLAAFAPFRHAFLIRDPRSLLASYAKVRATPTLADLGLRQQAWLYRGVRRPGHRLDRPARRARGGAAGAVRGARRAVLRGDAVLAGRAAPVGRRLGAVLVRQRVAVDRVHPGHPGPAAAARPGARAAARAVPALLRAAQRK